MKKNKIAKSVVVSVAVATLICISSFRIVREDFYDNTALKPQVMFFGTYHMANPGLDQVNPTAGDILSEERQREVLDLVNRLEKFKPTKIALELHPSDEQSFNERYNRYLNGSSSLKSDEREQLGMRLAKILGHKKLYGIQQPIGVGIKESMKAAGTLSQQQLISSFTQKVQEVEVLFEQYKDKSLLDVMRLHNGHEEKLSQYSATYLTIAQMGSNENPIGATEIGKWYTGNLQVFSNISRLIEIPDERILVIYGSGHGHLLKTFIEESYEMELVEVLPYLK